MTYLYETIPASEDEEPSRFEIKQSIHEDALTHHPETGQPIRRVILGGWGLVSTSTDGDPPPPSCCSPGCC